MKISKKPQRKGYAAILSVVVIGGFALALMHNSYRSSIRSMQAQRRAQLQIDYEVREQANLRALVSLIPVYAANTMMDYSATSDFKDNVSFEKLLTEAGTWAKMDKALPDSVAAQLGLTDAISGNTGDTTYSSAAEYVGAYEVGIGKDFFTLSAVEHSAAGNYPPPFYVRGQTGSGLGTRQNSNDSLSAAWTNEFPLLSSALNYDTTKDIHGGLHADASTYGHFNLIPYPNIHFGYGKPGELIVGRQNWWRIFMHPETKDMENTGVQRSAQNGGYVDREYILSIIEIPSQLAISSAAVTKIGQYADGAAWSNVTISGGLYAKKAIVTGVTTERVASTQGVTLSGGAVVGSSGQTVSDSNLSDRESFEAANANFYPISKSSDTARALFVAINRGNEFFDRFAHSYTKYPNDTTKKRLSYENWHEYSAGCNQCAMKLDVVATASNLDQTPTALRFTYLAGGEETQVLLAKPGVSLSPELDAITKIEWSEDGTSLGNVIPFHVELTAVGRMGIVVYINRLTSWLPTLLTPADGLDVNHSLVINADYNQANVTKPNIPSTQADTCVVLKGCNDLTAFPKGFSLVSNFRLYFVEDINQVEASAPSGVSTPFYPPLSIFVPEKRFAVDGTKTAIEYRGRLGSLSKDSSGINILDLKSGVTDAVAADRIKADLMPIKHPAELPPVNMMNWLVLIQRVHESEYSDY